MPIITILFLPVLHRRVFNQGLPEQFSFVTTFRYRSSAQGRGRRWHLIRVTDSRGQPQFAVGLDPNRKTVEFSIKKYDGSLQTLTWERPQASGALTSECGPTGFDPQNMSLF